MHILITGTPGTGKTTLGKILAKILRRSFYDIDTLIEEKTGMAISAIVKSRGWKYFRALEREAVKSLRNVTHAIISTGGGTLMDELNEKILGRHGIIIFLADTIRNLTKRLMGSKNRPSLTGAKDAIVELESVWKQRASRYKQVAHHIIQRSSIIKDAQKIIKIFHEQKK